MFGHSPPPVARAIRRQAGRGLTYMLPSEDALVVGRLLPERFGLPLWQIATTATDANRFALRVARAVTGRREDPGLQRLLSRRGRRDDGAAGGRQPVNRPGLAGEFRDLTETTEVVEFNDLAALEAALAARRRRLRHHRAGADQLLHGAARARLPRRRCAG